MGLLEDLQADRQWVKGQREQYNRLDKTYDAIKLLKSSYQDKVRDTRKDIFKDGLFRKKYDWKGANHDAFKAFGCGDVKTQIEDYYRNKVSGIDDVLDELQDAKYSIQRKIKRRFGFFLPFDELDAWLQNEISKLLN